ncbi:uncharacterized protein LOC142429573 [Tenrec ecaudatus]|uniref:uncharacterized protein LOC142429573 n=1 Tax=Tenrec ecaudatus TaxID=94439 RepID=UPI003F59ECD8
MSHWLLSPSVPSGETTSACSRCGRLSGFSLSGAVLVELARLGSDKCTRAADRREPRPAQQRPRDSASAARPAALAASPAPPRAATPANPGEGPAHSPALLEEFNLMPPPPNEGPAPLRVVGEGSVSGPLLLCSRRVQCAQNWGHRVCLEVEGGTRTRDGRPGVVRAAEPSGQPSHALAFVPETTSPPSLGSAPLTSAPVFERRRPLAGHLVQGHLRAGTGYGSISTGCWRARAIEVQEDWPHSALSSAHTFAQILCSRGGHLSSQPFRVCCLEHMDSGEKKKKKLSPRESGPAPDPRLSAPQGRATPSPVL